MEGKSRLRLHVRGMDGKRVARGCGLGLWVAVALLGRRAGCSSATDRSSRRELWKQARWFGVRSWQRSSAVTATVGDPCGTNEAEQNRER